MDIRSGREVDATRWPLGRRDLRNDVPSRSRSTKKKAWFRKAISLRRSVSGNFIPCLRLPGKSTNLQTNPGLLLLETYHVQAYRFYLTTVALSTSTLLHQVRLD